MLIVDSQVHIWGADTPERPWPGRMPAHRDVPFSQEELLREMDAAGVGRAIIVPPAFEGDRNDLTLAAAKAHPERFAVMGRIDIAAPGARESLQTWWEQPGMLGLRVTFSTPAMLLPLTEGRMDWVWAEAEKLAIPMMVLVSHANAHPIDRVAERHPALKLVMDHFALKASTKDEEAFERLDELLALAKRPNVAVKATALPCFTADRYPYQRLHPYIRRVYDAFGPRRLFWGSDLTQLPCTYPQYVAMFNEEIPWLTATDKEWVMGRGVCEWLQWRI